MVPKSPAFWPQQADFPPDRDGTGRDGGMSVQKAGIGNPANMPELGKDHAAGVMHGTGSLLPAGNLFGAVDAGCPGVALAAWLDLCPFADHETRTAALLVILGHQFVGDIAGLCAARAGQRWQDDAITQGVGAQLQRREECRKLAHINLDISKKRFNGVESGWSAQPAYPG